MTDGNTYGHGQPTGQPPGTPPGHPQPPGAPPGHPQAPGAPPHNPAASPWWAQNAATDPWRNPQTPAVVQRTPSPVLPPTEPHRPPQPKQGVGAGFVVVTALLCSLIAAFVGSALTYTAAQQGEDETGTIADRPHGDYQEMIAAVMPSVVTIWIDAGDVGGNGSGFVMSPEGYIVTNQHVASLAEEEGADVSVEFSDGREVDAEVVGGGKTTDIAVLKVDETDLESVSVADEEPQLGDTVVAVGAPLGLSHTVTEGIVSATDRPVLAGETEADATVTAAIQTDASINPGNSGGPLFNAAGQLVGVNTSIYTFVNSNEEGGSIGLGFAISSGQAVRVAESIIDNRGVPERTELGAEFDTTPVKELGATVKSVDNDAPAAEAGLEEGDLVTEFNGEKVLDEVHLAALVLKASPEDKVTVAYERGGDAEEVDVTLSASPDD